MKKEEFLTLDQDELSQDAAEAMAAYHDGRCDILDYDEEFDAAGLLTEDDTIGVFWFAAPASSAPGGPAMKVNVFPDEN